MPEMNVGYTTNDKGKPVVVQPAHIGLSIAIDLQKDDGSRTLVVPNVKNAEAMDFVQFWSAYEDMVRKARTNTLTLEDYQGTTITLTNPGTLGTNHSVPRLMQGQGAIIGVGALDYLSDKEAATTEK